MGAGDLTTLNAAKAWLSLGTANTTSDVLVSQLVTRASAFVLNFLNRTHIGLQQFTERYDGYGSEFILLRHAPVKQVLALSFLGTPIPPATGDGFSAAFSNGFVLDPDDSTSGNQRVSLFGFRTPRARSSVMVRYTAGFTAEQVITIPEDADDTVGVPGMWLGDVKVEGVDGSIFESVASAPDPGQYTVNAGTYNFNVADQGKAATITYSYVPADIEQAVIELIAERFKYMDRIGYASKTLAGQETVSFSLKSLNDFTRESLIPYKLVVPI